MRKIDVIFLFCVLGFAGFFAARSVTKAIPLLPSRTISDSADLGAAGQARDVDMTKLNTLLDQDALSDHEALFYQPVGPSSKPVGDEEEGGEKAGP